MTHFVSESCRGELCMMRSSLDAQLCLTPAFHEVSEEIMHDDPQPIRHPRTVYLCCSHFSQLLGKCS